MSRKVSDFELRFRCSALSYNLIPSGQLNSWNDIYSISNTYILEFSIWIWINNSFLVRINNSLPSRDSNLWPPAHQANMLPTKLSQSAFVKFVLTLFESLQHGKSFFIDTLAKLSSLHLPNWQSLDISPGIEKIFPNLLFLGAIPTSSYWALPKSSIYYLTAAEHASSVQPARVVTTN